MGVNKTMSIHQQCLYAKSTFEKRSIDPCLSLYAVVGLIPFHFSLLEVFSFILIILFLSS